MVEIKNFEDKEIVVTILNHKQSQTGNLLRIIDFFEDLNRILDKSKYFLQVCFTGTDKTTVSLITDLSMHHAMVAMTCSCFSKINRLRTYWTIHVVPELRTNLSKSNHFLCYKFPI